MENIMPDLKLAKLPDRTPIKITIVASPELNRSLHAYARLYQEKYGAAETVPELIPYILESFLESDRTFAKARKEGAVGDGSPTAAPARRVGTRRDNPPTSSSNAS
jgi:hypothetical protein